MGTFRRITTATGVFVHQWDMRGRDMKSYLEVSLFSTSSKELIRITLQAIFIGMVCWIAGILLVKVSILMEWSRTFAPAPTHNAFSRSCRFLVFLTVLFYLSIIIALLLSCSPVQRIWDKTVPGRCINLKHINLTAAIVNLLLNVIILLLPQKVIWGLQMSRAQRTGLSMMFAVGLTYVTLPISYYQRKHADAYRPGPVVLRWPS